MSSSDTPTSAAARSIVYDPEHLREEFVHNLDDFSTRVQTESVRALMGNDLLKQLRLRENRIRRRLDGDFTLVIIGDFKRGKSTLINALLGQAIATTNVTPETVTINEIQYGPEMKAEACLVDGGRVRLQPEEMQAANLVPLMESLPQKIETVSIEAPVEWLKGVRLVDTPGLGDVFNAYDRQVQAYLHEADAVLFVIQATSPLSDTEEQFLRLSLQPQDFPKLLFVVNMLDFARNENESNAVLGLIRDRVSRIFPSASIFGISALDELSRIQGGSRPNPERAPVLEAAFREMRATLEGSILLNKNLIQLDRASDQMRETLALFEKEVSLLKNAMLADQTQRGKMIADLEDDNSELSRNVEAHQRRMREEVKLLADQGVRWLSSFLDRFETDVVARLGEYRYEDVQRHFNFFLTDLLRQAMKECLSAHQPQIMESVGRARQAIQGDFQVTASVGVTAADVGVATSGSPEWTAVDTAGMVIDMFLPIDGLIKMAAKVLTKTAARGKTDTQQMDNYRERLQAGLPELRETATEQLRSAYSNLAVRLEQQIGAAYEKDRQQSLAALRQAQEIAAAGEQKVTAAQETFGTVTTLLDESRQALERFQEKLWPEEVATVQAVATSAETAAAPA